MADEINDEVPMARDTFSDLLWIPHSSHRVCQASEEKKEVINVKNYRCMTAYHAAYAPFLIRLGLYQIAVMPGGKIDAALIHGLVERWRPETHTFHLPFGEMTVTLEDVSCLWGLPITGVPVTGSTDGRNANGRLFELLGIKEHEQSELLKKRGSERNERSMELTFLKSKFRERFGKLPEDRDEQILKWYVRAYILDLMSSNLYPDSGGDGIPLWYLDLIVDLDTPVQYNWGGAVLAYLYRHLCLATEPGRGSMYGPVMLLQHWSWTRFPVLRPEPQTKNWEPIWGAPSLDACASFAYQWCCAHKYVASSHFKTQGARIPRGQFQSLTEDHVNWEPYGRVYSKLPTVTQQGRPYYLYRGPLIFYWIIEHTYPDRCMRQFGLFQEIPVPEPLNRHTHVELHKLMLGSKKNENWAARHVEYVQLATAYEAQVIREGRSFDQNDLPRYRKWYQKRCMASVYLFSQHAQGMDRTTWLPRAEHGPSGYIPSGPLVTRTALTGVGELAHGVKMFFTKGWRRLGKKLMRTGWRLCCDTGFGPRARQMMDEAGIPEHWETIPSDEPTPIGAYPYPEPPRFEGPDPFQGWLYDGTEWRKYISPEAFAPINPPHPFADPGQVSQDVGTQAWNPDSLLQTHGPSYSLHQNVDLGQVNQDQSGCNPSWEDYQRQGIGTGNIEELLDLQEQADIDIARRVSMETMRQEHPRTSWLFEGPPIDIGDAGASTSHSRPPIDTVDAEASTSHSRPSDGSAGERSPEEELGRGHRRRRATRRFTYADYPGHMPGL